MRDEPGDRSRRLISTHEAAQALGVHPQVLRLWAEQYGFPTVFAADGRRAFERRQIWALYAALRQDPAILDAIPLARGTLEPRDVA